MNARKQEANKNFQEMVSKSLEKRRLLVQAAVQAFAKNEDMVKAICAGERPSIKELAPLTPDERKIVFGIIATNSTRSQNVD